MKNLPLITVVTVCLNSVKTIEQTILSVINQTYKNIQYVIVDGNSNDGTKKIIEQYKNNIDIYISEKDDGLYDAFNKSLNYVNGEFFGFVNADDILLPDAISTLVKYRTQNPNIDFIFGSVKKHWGTLHGYRPSRIWWSWNFYSSHSTGFFIKTSSAKTVGLYNTKYKYCADLDYFYRAIVKLSLKGMATKKNEIFGIFRRGGISSKTNIFNIICEKALIRMNNKQNKFLVFLLFVYECLINTKNLLKKFNFFS